MSKRPKETREEYLDRVDEEFIWKCLENRKAIQDFLKKRENRRYLREAA